jgi:hypothetical protein
MPSFIGLLNALRPMMSPVPLARLLITAVRGASARSFLPDAPHVTTTEVDAVIRQNPASLWNTGWEYPSLRPATPLISRQGRVEIERIVVIQARNAKLRCKHVRHSPTPVSSVRCFASIVWLDQVLNSDF